MHKMEPSPASPLAYADPANLTKLRMLGGILAAAAMAPDVLEHWVTIAEDPAADGPTLRIIRRTVRRTRCDCC